MGTLDRLRKSRVLNEFVSKKGVTLKNPGNWRWALAAFVLENIEKYATEWKRGITFKKDYLELISRDISNKFLKVKPNKLKELNIPAMLEELLTKEPGHGLEMIAQERRPFLNSFPVLKRLTGAALTAMTAFTFFTADVNPNKSFPIQTSAVEAAVCDSSDDDFFFILLALHHYKPTTKYVMIEYNADLRRASLNNPKPILLTNDNGWKIEYNADLRRASLNNPKPIKINQDGTIEYNADLRRASLNNPKPKKINQDGTIKYNADLRRASLNNPKPKKFIFTNDENLAKEFLTKYQN